jgi:rubrerythrin
LSTALDPPDGSPAAKHPLNGSNSKGAPMNSTDNLKAAFAGESQANRKYLAFAEKAVKQGFPQVARLFRAAAAAETVHAHAHLRVLEGVKDTTDNLQAAIEGEAYEFQTMYPDFIKQAEAEGARGALTSFKNANAVEKEHHQLYSEALQAVKGGKDLPGAKMYVCSVCGHTVAGEAPERCPICGAAHEKFMAIE